MRKVRETKEEAYRGSNIKSDDACGIYGLFRSLCVRMCAARFDRNEKFLRPPRAPASSLFDCCSAMREGSNEGECYMERRG